MESLFYFCSQDGCRRKYKTDTKWVNHLINDHGVENPALPDPIPYNSKSEKKKNKNKKNQVSSQQTNDAVERARYQREMEDEAILDAEVKLKEKYEEEYINLQEETMRIVQRVKDNSDECCICCDAVVDTVVIPCGHAYFCYPCILNQQTNYSHKGCLFCRGHIDDIMKIFYGK